MWRKLRSPPTSSVPETQYNLATAEPLSREGHQVENADHPAILSNNVPTALSNAQDHFDKRAADMSQVAIEDSLKEDDSDITAEAIKKVDSSNSKKASSAYGKAQCSRPRLLTLLVCVSYLLFQLLGLDLGLRFINGYTAPRLNRAEVQLQATMSDVAYEQVINGQLDRLLENSLDQHFMENYEHCLLRGLRRATELFPGIDFTRRPDVRTQVMEWATDNCNKLLYAPQLHAPATSRLWTAASDFRSAVGNCIRLFRCKLRLVGGWFGRNAQVATKPAVKGPGYHAAKPSGVPLEMPFGFDIDCRGLPHCQLIYSAPSSPTTERNITDEAIAKANKEVLQWSWDFENISRVNGCVIILLSLLQPLLLVCYLFAVHLSQPPPQSCSSSKTSRIVQAWSLRCNTFSRLDHYEKLALGLITNTVLYKLLHYQREYFISEFDCLLLPVGLGFCIVHASMAVGFLNPSPEANDTLRSLCRAMYGLYIIARGAEIIPDPTLQKSTPYSQAEKSTVSENKPVSKIASHFISPLTSISEDLQQERRSMHTQQRNQRRDDFDLDLGYATETESEYDSDVHHTSYVDLTGGAIPAVSEEVEEWSIVED